MMAESNELSPTVTEDAVPLLVSSFSGVDVDPQQGSVSYQRPRRPGGGGGPLVPGADTEHVLQQVYDRASKGRPSAQPQDNVQPSPDPQQAQSQSGPSGNSHRRPQASEGESNEDDSSKDVIKGVANAIRQVLPSSISSSSLPSLPSPMKSLSLDPISQEDFEEYRSQLPEELKVDFYDAMILYEERDRKAVSTFLERVRGDVLLKKKVEPVLELYDEILPNAGMPPSHQLDLTLEQCTYVFLYVTKTFCGTAWTEFSAQVCLMNAIDNAASRWSVVPIFTEPKRKPTFKIPPSIRSLKGIQYWSEDKFYVDSLRKLLEDKLHIRMQKAKDLDSKRKNWIREKKLEDQREAERAEHEEQLDMERQKVMNRQHQEEMKNKEKMLKQHMERELKQIKIPDMNILANYNYHGSSHNAQTDEYMNSVFSHHEKTKPGSVKKSQSADENLSNQAMAEVPYLQQSWSMPGTSSQSLQYAMLPREQVPNIACNIRPDKNPYLWGQGYQNYNLFGQPIPGPQHAPFTPSCSAPHVDGRFWSQPSYVRQSSPAGQSLAAYTGIEQEKAHVSDKGFMSLPPHLGDVKHPPNNAQHENRVASLPLHTSTPAVPPRTAGNANNTVMGYDLQGGKGMTGENSRGAPEWKENRESEKQPDKEDLVEDVARDGASMGSQCGPCAITLHPKASQGGPLFSEAVSQPPVFADGPGHHASSRVRGEPAVRTVDPRAMPSTGPGQGPALNPLPYMPHPLYPLHAAQYSGFIPQHPGYFPQYPGSVSSGYIPSNYVGHPSHSPVPFPPEYSAPYPHHPAFPHPQLYNPHQPSAYSAYRYPAQSEHHGQGSQNALQPVQPPPQPGSQSYSYPSPAAHRAVGSLPPAVVHHYHHHDREEVTPTINYIKKAENVMLGSEINMARSEGPHQSQLDLDPSSVTESLSGPQGFQASRHQEQSGAEYSQPSYYTQPTSQQSSFDNEQSPLSCQPSSEYSYQAESTLTDPHNRSTLTHTVSRDDQSRRLSGTSSACTGLSDLPVDLRQSLSSTATSGRSQGVDQWHEGYEQARETDLKQFVVGPSD